MDILFTPDLIGKASNLSPLQMMLADGLRYILFIIFRKGPSILYFPVFSIRMNVVGGTWVARWIENQG